MIASTRRAALGAILAAPLASVPAAVASSDLARACDWAIAHVHWINTNDEPIEAWPDERLDAELLRIDAVLDRVADEPAGSLSDLAAKARLLLCDWEASLVGHELHSGERALLTFLAEVSACA